MGNLVDTEPLDNYRNKVSLYELDGEIPGYDYAAFGEVNSSESASRLARLADVHLEEGDETYTGIEVQVFFQEKHYDKMGRELFRSDN